MQSYRDLEIYQIAHQAAIRIHQATMQLPKFELYEEGSQIRRSAKAAVSDMVEGFCRRRYQGDYLRFLVYAHGSCNETIEHLEILYESGSLPDKSLYIQLNDTYEKLGAKINRFIQSITRSLP